MMMIMIIIIILGMEVSGQKAMIAGVNTNAVLTLSGVDLSLIG